jgi:hypothetical protein
MRGLGLTGIVMGLVCIVPVYSQAQCSEVFASPDGSGLNTCGGNNAHEYMLDLKNYFIHAEKHGLCGRWVAALFPS